jgi:hypothetical protein
MLQLNDEDWQAHQETDIGYTAAEIDDMIYDIDYELDLQARYDKYDTFNQFYYDNLLYDLPLVSRTFRTAVWTGYGGPNNEKWDPQEGIMPSRALGAKWEAASTPATRKSALDEMVLSTTIPNSYLLDPWQSEDSAQTDITRYMHSSFLSFDKNWLPHPDLAWNFAFDVESKTFPDAANWTGVLNSDIGSVEFTFLLRDDAFWSATVDKDGNVVPAEAVDANDFRLTMDMYATFVDSALYDVNGEDTFNYVLDYEVGSTLRADDTFTVWFWDEARTPDDIINYGAISPLPDHLLGGTLTYLNGTEPDIFSPVEVGMVFNPWDSEEWNSWESVAGHTLVGAYALDDLVEGEYYTYSERDDFYFPNEWDVATYDDGADTEQAALETHFGVDFSTWAPSDTRTDVVDTAYYWAYAGTEATKVKPTTQNLAKFTWLSIIDVNNRLLKFEAGELDAFGSDSLGAEQVNTHVNDPRFQVKTVVPNRGPELLIFNLLNPHLQFYDVRKAISLALDREKFVAIQDGFASPWFSIAYPNSGVFDNVQATGHEYSYEGARDLMLGLGYAAADSNEEIPDADVAGLGEVAGLLGLPGFEFYIALFSVFVMIPIVRRRK